MIVAGTHPRIPREILGASVVVVDPTPRLAASIAGLDQLRTSSATPRMTVWASRQRAVFSHADLCDVEIIDGRRIIISPRRDTNVEQIRALLHGPIASIVLAQQGRFALHASTVQIGNHRVAVSGASGAGKSTTALRLVQRGATPIVDDVTLLDVSDGVATTVTWGRDAHIWPHVAEDLNVDVSDAVMRGGPRPKWALAWPPAPEGPVRDIVVLRATSVDQPVIDTLPPLATLRMLGRCVHYNEPLRQVWPNELFAWQVELARSTRIVRLRRPVDSPTLEGVCDMIEHWVANSPSADDQE